LMPVSSVDILRAQSAHHFPHRINDHGMHDSHGVIQPHKLMQLTDPKGVGMVARGQGYLDYQSVGAEHRDIDLGLLDAGVVDVNPVPGKYHHEAFIE
jgi:hypothetical protein